jgi:hypothetical protein
MKHSLALLIFAVACATAPTAPTLPDPLVAVEARLRDLPTAQMRYYVETSGTMNMLARGSLSWDESQVRIDAGGNIGGQQKSIRYERPVEHRTDVLTSWVRIGLGHNLFRVMSGNETEGIEAATTDFRGDPAHFTFDIVIGGTKMGSAELWLDANGLPLRREQTMHFPDGDMKVTERYLWLR